MKLNDKKVIMPLTNYVIVRPFDINPHKTRVSQSGLILATGNSYDSQETGEQEQLDLRVQYAIVMEVGPECKSVEVGDEVYYDKLSAYPLPILDLGFHRINENNIIAYVRGEGDSIADAMAFEKQLVDEYMAKQFKSSLSIN